MFLAPEPSPAPNRIQNYRTLAYVIIILVYLVIGAAIFDKLESKEEVKRHDNITARIALFQQRHNITTQEFLNLTRTVENRLQYRKKQWKFIGSFYYATVVLALIGYGHAIPSTKAGRAVTIAYALIGIPMWLIMIQSVGERLNALIRFVLKQIKRKFQKRREPQITAMEILICEALLVVLTVTTGSYVFLYYEKWKYFEAFYYCLLTLTTIGFGDLVPMQRDDYGSSGWFYRLFCIMFILVGLTIVASSGNLLILRFVETNTKRCQHERYEMEERRRQKVSVIGDVISSNGCFITIEEDDDDNSSALYSPPDGAHRLTNDYNSSNLSLCSCRGQLSCIPISCKKRFQRQPDNTRIRSKKLSTRSDMNVPRTLRERILYTLHGKNDIDEQVVLERSYLELDKVRKRSSI